MTAELTLEFLNQSIGASAWDFGNQVLYNMCRENPDHKTDEIIVGKIWLIGRAYSAAIERRRGPNNAGADSFYESEVVPKIRDSKIDEWFEEIRTGKETDLALHLEVHKRVVDLFAEISGLKQRSLASKYLHFHFPKRFYIYDSRAQKAIRHFIQRAGRRLPELGEYDYEYAHFVVHCQSLLSQLEAQFARSLTPRELDNLLLSYKPQAADAVPS